MASGAAGCWHVRRAAAVLCVPEAQGGSPRARLYVRRTRFRLGRTLAPQVLLRAPTAARG